MRKGLKTSATQILCQKYRVKATVALNNTLGTTGTKETVLLAQVHAVTAVSNPITVAI